MKVYKSKRSPILSSTKLKLDLYFQNCEHLKF